MSAAPAPAHEQELAAALAATAAAHERCIAAFHRWVEAEPMTARKRGQWKRRLVTWTIEVAELRRGEAARQEGRA